MKLEFEYGHGTMAAELPDSTDIFIPGETVKDPDCIPEDKLDEIRRKLAQGDLFQDSIGIYNVNNRLRIVYGSSYRLQIQSRLRRPPSSDGTGGEDGGTLVTLRIRAMKKKELEEYVQTINRG